MPLRPHDQDTSCWIADPPLTAGAHALVVGISDYPHLSGGNGDLAPRNGGLGQLEVSAISAARFFHWLSGIDEILGAPLASCRLLLAPRPDEKAEVDALTGGQYGRADFRPLRDAVEDWGNAVAAGGRTSDPNVAVYFHSGHGLEISVNPAVVARDFLDPESVASGAGNALALDPLARAIKSYGVDRALFLIDACRDSTQLTEELDVVGQPVLKIGRKIPRRPDAVIILHSTASSLKSYQLATDPATLFSQAVLEALEGPEPTHLPYDTSTIPWQLLFSALEGHVKRRVAELLAERSALAHQMVEPDGMPYLESMLVARKHRPQPGTPPPVTLSVDASDAAAALSEAIETTAGQVLESSRPVQGNDIEVARQGCAADDDLTHSGIMHAVFGHEYITDRWVTSLHVLDAASEEPVSGMLHVVRAHVAETADRVSAWIDVAVEPREGHALWIATEGEGDVPSFAIVVPQDPDGHIPLRLDVTLEARANWATVDLSARIGDPSGFTDIPVPFSWGLLWDVQRTEIFGDLGAAVGLIERVPDLEEILRYKTQSPVAAALACTYLLRSGALDRLHDWPRNLANWYKWIPDGPALWAEALMQRHEASRSASSEPDAELAGTTDADWLKEIIESSEYVEARKFFAMLATRGAPHLGATMKFAARQAQVWRSALAAELLAGEETDDLRTACDIVERASRPCVSGSSFARFAGRGIALTPAAVLGTRVPLVANAV